MILILEERKPIEPNHLVGDAAFAKLVRNSFGDHDYDLLCDEEEEREGGVS